ncbi:MAG: hypothetical protein ACN4E2_00995, partial [Nitrospinota bacterium]
FEKQGELKESEEANAIYNEIVTTRNEISNAESSLEEVKSSSKVDEAESAASRSTDETESVDAIVDNDHDEGKEKE